MSHMNTVGGLAASFVLILSIFSSASKATGSRLGEFDSHLWRLNDVCLLVLFDFGSSKLNPNNH